jgi:hypothetical protein
MNFSFVEKKIPDQTKAQVLVSIRGFMLKSQNHRKLREKHLIRGLTGCLSGTISGS